MKSDFLGQLTQIILPMGNQGFISDRNKRVPLPNKF